MNAITHPEVEEYLRSFDRAASRLPRDRRVALRNQVIEHFLDAVPEDADPDAVRRVIEQFGTPAEIVAGELTADPSRPRRRGWVIALVVVAVALLVLVLAPLLSTLLFFGATPRDAAPLPGDARANVVTEEPEGKPRVTEGRAFAEYDLERETLGELPDGAAWPIGVPEGLDVGEHDGVVMEAGMGANVAQFTYLCAWEDEYLLAEQAGDERRLARALQVLVAFSKSDFVTSASPDGGWYRNVVEPLTFGMSSSGLSGDRAQSCGGAGISVPIVGG